MFSTSVKKLKTICSLVILLAVTLMPFANIGARPVQAQEAPQVAPINPDLLEFWENPPEPFYGYVPPPKAEMNYATNRHRSEKRRHCLIGEARG